MTIQYAKSIVAMNVCEALPLAVQMLKQSGVERSSRAGKVLELGGLVVTTYLRPQQRVLTDPVRDANPFFHFFEALWMLAGREDVAFLTRFNKGMMEYSDDGTTFHAPYGHRMRVAFGMDQLKQVINILRSDPTSRQAVVQIWDAEMDLNQVSKDIPCNDLIFFKIRNGQLQMTVCCRSNDAVWGAYGANAVHFSMIMEYVAGMIGVPVGQYHQISDSLHAYVDNPKWQALSAASDTERNPDMSNPYMTRGVEPFPMVSGSQLSWDTELSMFFSMADKEDSIDPDPFTEPFFMNVVIPMFDVWRAYKEGGRIVALNWCKYISATDWRLACEEWITRRIENEAK